jgi:hypothetical protein
MPCPFTEARRHVAGPFWPPAPTPPHCPTGAAPVKLNYRQIMDTLSWVALRIYLQEPCVALVESAGYGGQIEIVERFLAPLYVIERADLNMQAFGQPMNEVAVVWTMRHRIKVVGQDTAFSTYCRRFFRQTAPGFNFDEEAWFMDVHEDGVFKQERTVEIKSASARAGAGEGSFAGYSGIYSGCLTISDVSDAHLGGDKVDGDNLMHQMSSLSDASGVVLSERHKRWLFTTELLCLRGFPVHPAGFGHHMHNGSRPADAPPRLTSFHIPLEDRDPLELRSVIAKTPHACLAYALQQYTYFNIQLAAQSKFFSAFASFRALGRRPSDPDGDGEPARKAARPS